MKDPLPFELLIENNLGKKVAKKSNKPFASGKKVNTIRGIIDHPILHVPAYIFNEDDTYVRASYCYLLAEPPLEQK